MCKLLFTFLLTLLLFSTKAQAYSQVLNNVIVKSDAFIAKGKLDNTLKPFLGKDIDLKLLQKVLDELSYLYKESGYLGAQAFYPDQQSSNGVIEVVVATAKLNEITLNNLSDTSYKTVYKLFSKVRESQNKTINTKDLNEALLKVKDLNVFDVAGYFEKSQLNDDGVDLNIDIKPKNRFGYQFFYDNYGTESTGKNRFVGVLNTHNLTKHADTAYLVVARTDKAQNNLDFSYKLPVNQRLDEVGLKLSYGSYDISKSQTSLDTKGTILDFGLFVKDPIYRTINSKASFEIGADIKCVKDKFEDFDVSLSRQLLNGYTSFRLDNYFENLNLSHGLKANFVKVKPKDEYQIFDERSYAITTFDSDIVFDFATYFSLSNSLLAQVSTNSVDSADKFTIGGPYGVKAYQSNVASSDNGLFDDLKLTLKLKSSPSVNLFTNFMQAHAKNDNGDKESFYGIGLGADFYYQGFFIEGSINKAIGKNKIYAKDKTRFLIKFGYAKV